MGETRVDLEHLLEDLRDAYPSSLEETILTEIIANSLDSGAGRIVMTADPAQGTLTAVDNGSGMQRTEMRSARARHRVCRCRHQAGLARV